MLLRAWRAPTASMHVLSLAGPQRGKVRCEALPD